MRPRLNEPLPSARPRLETAPAKPSKPKIDLPAPALEEEEYESSCNFIPTGGTMLDYALGGGWAEGRIINIVGDRSSGKTLLAIEACANFVMAGYKPKDIRYAETEAAFDDNYAKSIGLPDGIQFLTEEEEFDTVEGWNNDITAWLKKRKSNQGPCLYILDSMDALSDDAEMEREIGKDSFGASKAKKLSEMFRRLVRLLKRKNCTLIVISQLREAIGVMFGEKHRRSGGKALDFYCTQILWLYERGKIKKKVRGNDYVVGLNVLARVKKNKVGLAHREVPQSIIFSYGVDDEVSMLDWLKGQKATNLLALDEKECLAAIETCRKEGMRDALEDVRDDLKAAVKKRWKQIEKQLAPTMKKYGG